MSEPGSTGTTVRARLDLSYDGTDFSGWASQPGLRTVQGELEAALARVVRNPEGDSVPVRLVVAGRTDAGVHARGQVAHVDIPWTSWERLPGRSDRSAADGLRARLDGVLPSDVVVHQVTAVSDDFDARFSALQRRYAYRVQDQPGRLDPLLRRHVLTWETSLDVASINAASAALMGLRDFAPFCRSREGATTIRDLKEFTWRRESAGPDSGLLVATVRADAFCHSMVRSLVGAVLAVGSSRRDLDWLAQVAAEPTRSAAVAVAPAHGLTLEQVDYPADEELATRAEATRARRQR